MTAWLIKSFLLCLLNVAAALLLSPLAEGLMRKLRAAIHSRIGPPTVATIPEQGGVVTAGAAGTATITATFGGFTATQTVTVTSLPAAATLVTFNDAYAYSSSTPVTIQSGLLAPGANVTITWGGNVGLFDRTTTAAASSATTCGRPVNTTPVVGRQVYSFSAPVSLPSLWLTTTAGAGRRQQLGHHRHCLSDAAGTVLLGTVTVTTPTHGGPGYFQWVQCTRLNSACQTDRS